MKYAKSYLVFTVLVWLPWGLLCIFDTAIIAEVIGVTSSSVSGTTDLRAMYGGVQTAVGLMAALALYDLRHFKTVLFVLSVVGGCLALSRAYGLIVDGRSTPYTFGVLAYESFAALSASVWLGFLRRNEKR